VSDGSRHGLGVNRPTKVPPAIEQVRKGGLPPLATDLSSRGTAGVNHPSLLVRFWLVGF